MDRVKRGDFVTVALPGDFGKPRPALVVQADRFSPTSSVAVLPLTSALVDATLLRVDVTPNVCNGLRTPSQVMIDKPITVSRAKVGSEFGVADEALMLSVGRALATFLDLA